MTNMHIVVTGAPGGIGGAVSLKLAEFGHLVMRVGRRLPLSPGVAGRTGAGMDIEADLAKPSGWERVAGAATAAGRPIDALVHCAGALEAADFPSMHGDGLRAMLDDNILTLLLGFRALLPGMIAHRRGRLIVIGSLGGIVPMPHLAVYAAAKFAVRGFTLSMAEELRGSGVEVSLVSCGPVDTRMLRRETLGKGTIGFTNHPLAPEAIADVVVTLLARPRREVILPRSQSLLSPLVGAFHGLFTLAYPIGSALGTWRKGRYRGRIERPAIISGERP